MNIVHLSERTARRAHAIAQELIKDSVFRPSLLSVAQYGSYFRFRNAHRAALEQTRDFESRYLGRILKLAESERRRSGAGPTDSAAEWDTWYERMVEPIKALIWSEWENHHNLESRYFEALLKSGTMSPSELARLAAADSNAGYSYPWQSERRPIWARIIEGARRAFGLSPRAAVT